MPMLSKTHLKTTFSKAITMSGQRHQINGQSSITTMYRGRFLGLVLDRKTILGVRISFYWLFDIQQSGRLDWIQLSWSEIHYEASIYKRYFHPNGWAGTCLQQTRASQDIMDIYCQHKVGENQYKLHHLKDILFCLVV